MKTTKSILTSIMLMALIATSAMAQSQAKVVAVINKASWCHICEENAGRAMSAFKVNNTDNSILFIANDLSDEATKKESSKALNNVGLLAAVADFKSTGMVYFFNAETKVLINQVSVARSDDKLAKAMLTAKSSLQ